MLTAPDPLDKKPNHRYYIAPPNRGRPGRSNSYERVLHLFKYPLVLLFTFGGVFILDSL